MPKTINLSLPKQLFLRFSRGKLFKIAEQLIFLNCPKLI